MRDPGKVPITSVAQTGPRTSHHSDPARKAARAPGPRAYLLLRLCLLDVVPAHLDARGEDPSGEIRHVDTQEVGHFLGSCDFSKSKEGRGEKF